MTNQEWVVTHMSGGKQVKVEPRTFEKEIDCLQFAVNLAENFLSNAENKRKSDKHVTVVSESCGWTEYQVWVFVCGYVAEKYYVSKVGEFDK